MSSSAPWSPRSPSSPSALAPDLSSGVFTDTAPHNVAVSVRGLSKSYSIAKNAAQHTTAGEALMHRLRHPFAKAERETFLALDDVSFDIQKGDVVGIIGRNGAGKSTLLKILSRITEPTKGRIDLYGRVGSLLEVGTGFHPELTGRENIFLNGAILGMQKSEIARQFDAIVDFSGTEQFLDTPVKRYSSGMYVRLAFAVAAHLNPEILIIDEVLAVGDAEFQKKCLGKMKEVSEGGRTVLFVSHNMQAVSTLTNHCIVLSHGRSVFQGGTQEAISHYLREGGSSEEAYEALPSPTEPRVTYARVRTSESNNTQRIGKPMEIDFHITSPVAVNGAAFSLRVFNEMHQPILHLLTLDSEIPMCRQPGVYRLTCSIPKLHMYTGHYFLNIYLAEKEGGKLFQMVENICPFEVVVHEQLREYYWQPGSATYIEEATWHVANQSNYGDTL